MATWVQLIVDDTWVQVPSASFDLINNASVLDVPIDNTIYKTLEVRVADTEDELEENPTDTTTVATNINDLKLVADSIREGGTSAAGGQFLGQGVIKAVQYMAKTTASSITVGAGLSSFSVEEITFENGGSIILEDGATYKVI